MKNINIVQKEKSMAVSTLLIDDYSK